MKHRDTLSGLSESLNRLQELKPITQRSVKEMNKIDKAKKSLDDMAKKPLADRYRDFEVSGQEHVQLIMDALTDEELPRAMNLILAGGTAEMCEDKVLYNKIDHLFTDGLAMPCPERLIKFVDKIAKSRLDKLLAQELAAQSKKE